MHVSATRPITNGAIGDGIMAPRSYETVSHAEESRALWLAFLAKNVLTYDVAGPLGTNDGFRLSAGSRQVEGFTLARVATSAGACLLERTASRIAADGQDRMCLYIPLASRIEVTQLGRTVSIAGDQMTLCDGVEPMSHTKFGDNDTLCFLMPRAFVDQRVVHAEEICARTLNPGNPMGQLVRDTLVSLYHTAPKLDDGQFKRSAAIAGELVLLAIGDGADTVAGASSVRSANLARAKRLIRDRLDDLDLTIAVIAHVCGFSISYLHNLFRDDGRTVWEYVTQERLCRARTMLASGGTRVTDVALSCGYSNLSQFSTAFKRAFGVSPRDVLSGVH